MHKQAPPTARAVFDHALDLHSQDRERYLAAACGGDGELRRKVDALLQAHHDAGSFLEVPAVGAAPGLRGAARSSCPPGPERPGAAVGPYVLLEQIGEGGMGVVFLAEQTRPVRRQVALKVIKAGMDTRQVIARFDAERQALALMDHPNIARVLDGGATDTGRPYFVMELVKGVPVTRYCDEHRLTLRQRLELFVQVCGAVQHAHTKGVIHRDLKPNNVLVASYDGRPVPKVIDFGVAKATGGRLTEQTLFTGFGALVGTPEYMSPEQAELNQPDVDTRSDVYSLGVLLYELLTGTTPLERGRVKPESLLEVLRVVREQEPPRPSTRLGATGGLPSIAANRGLEPKKLSGVVRGELDWIVMRALEKDRNRRYETALGLARDVERYLNDEPVAACPPSASYRVRKLARRNRAALVTLTSLALGALAGVVGLTVSNTRIRQEAAAKQAALDAAKASKQEAVENLRDALRAVDQIVARVAEERPQHPRQVDVVRAEALKDAVTFYQKFLERESSDPSIRQQAALVYRGLGRLHHYFGRYADSETNYRKAVELLEGSGGDPPADVDAAVMLIETRVDFCSALESVGKPEEGEAALRGGVELAEKLAERFPDHPQVVSACVAISNRLAWLLHAREPDRAETMLLRNLRRTDDLFSLDAANRALGDLYLRAGRHAEAEAAYRRAADCAERMLAERPDKNWVRSCVAEDLQGLAAAQVAQGQAAEAEKVCRRAIGIRSQLAAEYPTGPSFRNALADAHFRQGEILRTLGRAADAEAAFASAVEGYTSLTADFPDVALFRQSAVDGGAHLAAVLIQSGRAREAIPLLERAWGHYEKLPGDFAGRLHRGRTFVHYYVALGWRLQAQGAAQDATPVLDRAVEIHERLAAAPDVAGHPAQLARADLDAANALRGCDRPTDTERLYRRALERLMRLAGESPGSRQVREDLARARFDFADYYRWMSDHVAEAETLFRQALREYQGLSADFQQEPAYRIASADCRERLGSVLLFLSRADEAAKELTQAVERATELAAQHPADRTVRMTLAMASRHWGEAARGAAPPADIAKAFRRAERVLETLVADVPDNGWYGIEWCVTCRMLAGLLARDLDDPAGAEGFYRRAAGVSDKLVADFPHDKTHRSRRAEVHREWGLYLRDSGRDVEANEVLALAADDLRWLADSGSDDFYEVWYPLALLDLATGRRNYRAVCKGLLARQGQAERPSTWAVRTLTMAPDAVADPSEPVRLAEKLLAANPADPELQGLLGATLYRNGDFAAAVERLEASVRTAPAPGVYWQKLFLAMAFHRLGRAADTRSLLEEAARWVDQHAREKLRQDAELQSPLPWQLRLDVQLLRQEAEGLLRVGVRAGEECGSGT